MEIPDLSSSSVWCFDDHVSIVNQVEVSVLWQFRDNIEVPLDVKTELLIEFSLSWLTLPLVNIHNIPLLIDLTMGWMNNDVLLLSVNSTLDVKYLSILDVSDESAFLFEELPPS
jgi:hypothetical protein